jgi:hypothetical protein
MSPRTAKAGDVPTVDWTCDNCGAVHPYPAGEYLLRLRKAAKLPRKTLAGMLGLHAFVLQRGESGAARPHPDHVHFFLPDFEVPERPISNRARKAATGA